MEIVIRSKPPKRKRQSPVQSGGSRCAYINYDGVICSSENARGYRAYESCGLLINGDSFRVHRYPHRKTLAEFLRYPATGDNDIWTVEEFDDERRAIWDDAPDAQVAVWAHKILLQRIQAEHAKPWTTQELIKRIREDQANGKLFADYERETILDAYRIDRRDTVEVDWSHVSKAAILPEKTRDWCLLVPAKFSLCQ
ncbi:hypothetical protein SAMN02949497_1706 [Methylomagnum ishizawai]|uniref:Uncharacterized protein n=1 Tax=Methylomagnum ishizawai TaxID=1760988 RepID=A0A1Y6D1E8_9GAMM|nr:hypothetical protein SAMN02949497_1706 [Methylomagnum ishizawai]